MATSKTNVLDFLAQRSNIAGCVFACAVVLGGFVMDVETLLTLGFGAASYVSGFLIFSSPKRSISLVQADDEVEVKTIQANIIKLRSDIEQHTNRIPDEILAVSENIFNIVEEIIPKWKELNSFGDQKYVINSIITQYFPESITSYMNLPKSYYRNGAKSKAAEEIKGQLEILLNALEGIRDSLYAGVEKDIKLQSQFLKDKFVTNTEGGFRLQ